MDLIINYDEIIYFILKEYVNFFYFYGKVKCYLIFSEDKLYYLFLIWGWENR